MKKIRSKKIRFFLLILSVLTTVAVFVINIFSAEPNEVHKGDATYYETAHLSDNWACELDPLSGEVMVAALNSTDLDNFTLSGAYVEVTGPTEKKVTVRIVDKLPSTNVGDIDLSPEAFAEIAELAKGRVKVSWKIVPGNVEGPVKYHFSEGSNSWWAAIQVRNHKYPVAKFEYKSANGDFIEVKREGRNYFQCSNMGNGPFTFRVTDIYGQVLTHKGIEIVDNGDASGDSQFLSLDNQDTNTLKPSDNTSTPDIEPTSTPNNSSKPNVTDKLDSADEEWKEYVDYKAGDNVMYKGTVYICIQSHTSLPGWYPDVACSLWKK